MILLILPRSTQIKKPLVAIVKDDMKKFESLFNYKYYIIGLFVLAVPIFFVTFCSWMLIKNISDGEPLKEWGMTMLMPSFWLLFILMTIRHFYILSPKIIITDNSICIGSKHFKIKDIVLISIRAKSKAYFCLIPYRFESSILSLTTGEEISIAVENYSNGNLIRLNLERVNNYLLGRDNSIGLVEKAVEFEKSRISIDLRTAIKFMRSPFKFVNNYLFGTLCLVFLLLTFRLKPVDIYSVGFCLLMFSMFYVALIAQNHYFLLTDKHLVVKNLFLPTRQRIFSYDNIDYLESEDLPKQETSLKILTKDFRIYRFQSGLMTYSMFTDLIRKVNERQNNGHQQKL